MLIGSVILIIILLIIIILIAAALLLSTGNPPEGEISGVYGVVFSIETFLVEIVTAAGEWLEYIAGQIQQLGGSF
jgi:hypothetical protein